MNQQPRDICIICALIVLGGCAIALLALIELSWGACGIVVCIAFAVTALLITLPPRRPRNRRVRPAVWRQLWAPVGAWAQRRRLSSIRLPARSPDLEKCRRDYPVNDFPTRSIP